LVEIEVGRRRGRSQYPAVGQADADGVAHEDDAAVRVMQREVVLGMTGRVDGGEGSVR
jgi:hypothetical protein